MEVLIQLIHILKLQNWIQGYLYEWRVFDNDYNVNKWGSFKLIINYVYNKEWDVIFKQRK